MSSKLQLILKGSGFRILQTLISIAIGIMMMPFLISTLGKELYGLWIVISSVVSSYYLLDLGFNQAVTRYVTKYIHQDDPASANRVINTALVIYSALGALLFLFSVLAAHFGTNMFMTDKEHLSLAQVVLIVSGLSIALEFPAKAFPGIISAYLRFDVIASVRFSKSILDAVLIYVSVSHGYGLVAMALITFTTGVISTLIYVRFSTSLFKQLQFSRRHVDSRTFKSIFHFSKWVFVFDINSMIRDKMDVWLIAYYLGNVALPVYYVGVRLIDYAITFMQQATGFSGPIFTEYYVKNQKELLNKSFSLFLKVNIVLGVTVAVGFYILGYAFIALWMHGSVSTLEAYQCLMVLAMGRFMVYFTTPVQSFLMTINRHKIGAWISLFETLFAWGLCIWLIPHYGLIGASLGIAIPYVIGRAFILPLFIYKYINVNLVDLAGRIVFFTLCSLSFAWAIYHYVPSLMTLNLIELFIVGVAVVIVQLLLSISIWSSLERQWIFDTLLKKWQSFSLKR